MPDKIEDYINFKFDQEKRRHERAMRRIKYLDRGFKILFWGFIIVMIALPFINQ